jgi:pimeloyl-ACP methyl ester carboxylesterase
MVLLSLLLLFSSAFAEAAPQAFDAELSQFEYPHPVKMLEIQSQKQKLKMAYMDVPAQKANGLTVVLLHGKNFGAFYWEPTIEALTKAGFRVVAPDQIGFGKSSKPDAYQFSLQGLAENTLRLLDELKIEKAIVVGHSMGGMLAARFALMHPDRVSRLVLVNPIGLEDWKTMVSYRGIDELYRAELKATPDSIREYQKNAYYGGEWKPEYEPLIRAQAGWALGPDWPKVAWNSALTSEMIFTQPVIYEFPLIKAPTLLIIGLRDRTAIGKAWASKDVAARMGDYTKLGKRAAKAIPHAKLVEIKGVGHVPQIENFPAYEKALLGFLR